MKVLAIVALSLMLGGCALAQMAAEGDPNSPNWHPPDMTLEQYHARLAWERAHPYTSLDEYRRANAGEDYSDKMDDIDATTPPACGICDPITPATPDGTYTLPPQNRGYGR